MGGYTFTGIFGEMSIDLLYILMLESSTELLSSELWGLILTLQRR